MGAEKSARRRALLIANGNFLNADLSGLPGVEKDFHALQAVLGAKELGNFEVIGLLNKDLLTVRREIAAVCDSSKSADTLLIYYSGTGICDLFGSLHLPVFDSDPKFVDATSIDANFILNRIRLSQCQKVILIVDSCHSGAFFENNRGIPNGLFAITACGAQQFAFDTPDGGEFTKALINGLESADADQDGDGRISADEIFDFICKTLSKKRKDSVPQKWVWNVPGPIYITAATPKVFLSYCRQDFAAAQKLKTALERQGFSIWIDTESIHSGDWKSRVTDGLNRARAMVFLMTADSLKASAVQRELEFAHAKGIPIIPIVFNEPIAIPDWYTFDYHSLHRHTLDKNLPNEQVKKLADAIRKAKR
jgi:hypothetical protein